MVEPPHSSDTTDGMDFRGAVKNYYACALKRYGKYIAIFASMFMLVFVTGIDYLLPVSIVGFFGLLFTVILLWGSFSGTWRCSRVMRTYPLRFRGPVEKVELKRNQTYLLTIGGPEADATSPVFLASDPLSRRRWPEGIADGVWFAGDDPFGGAALVPGSGELLFMQPKDWDATAKERAAAGEERTRKARRAGIKRRARIQ